MENNLFVGGFPFETSEDDLRRFFAPAGAVVSVKLLFDRKTRRPRGLAFVEMASEDEARKAMAELDGKNIGPRAVFVTAARPKPEGEGFEGGPARGERAPREERPAPTGPEGVERRSGQDRRKGWGKLPAGREERRFGDRKPFGERKFGDRKPFGKKPFGERKPWQERGEGGGGGRPAPERSEGESFRSEKPFWKKKPFGEKRSFGDKKPWEKRDRPAFGDKKPWGEKKPWGDKKPFGEKKPWQDRKPGDKPGFGGPKKPRWGAGGPGGGKKPGDFKRKPRPFRP